MVERIRTLLESRQLTPTQFADLIGVARPIISHILSGRNKPSLDVVQRILAAMPDLSMAWLLNGAEPMLALPLDTTSITSVPVRAEAPTAPVAAAPLQPIAVAQVSTPLVASHLAAPPNLGVNQSYRGQNRASDMALAPVAVPVVAATPLVTESVTAAATVPVSQLMSQAARRPPMPRRFSAKPSVANQPGYASSAGALTPIANTVPAPEFIPAAAEASVPVLEGSTAAAVATAVQALTSTEIADRMKLGADATVFDEPSATIASPADEVAPKVVTPNPDLPARETAQAGASADVPASSVGAAPAIAPTLASDMASALFKGPEKPIRRIVIFYRDGSFADYHPE